MATNGVENAAEIERLEAYLDTLRSRLNDKNDEYRTLLGELRTMRPGIGQYSMKRAQLARIDDEKFMITREIYTTERQLNDTRNAGL